MQTLSSWASHNRVLARIIITLCQLLIYAAAMYTGAWLEDAELHIPVLLVWVSLVLCICCLLLYAKGPLHNQYFFSRTAYFLVGVCAFVCICFVYNDTRRVSSFNNYTGLHGSLVIKEASKKESTATIAASLSKKELRQRAKLFRSMMQSYQKSGNHTAGNIAWTILVIIGALALTGIVAGLACSLSCSGSGVAGAIVGILGAVGVIWLTVFFLKKVWRKKPLPRGERSVSNG